MNLLFSIITPIYKTPIKKLHRLYNSLLEQTHSNWEWIVFDDSPSDYKISYDYIKELSTKDERIKLYTENKNIGIIGKVKNKAFSYGNGDILVEVDHDDELIDTCLENLNIAYNYSNEIGFVYGNACEIYEDAKNSNDILDYGNDWAYGYGGYKKAIYKDKEYKVAVCANINPKTIRHITSAPNHVRSWRKNVYDNIGGHNKRMSVADDYELIIRTFLNTKIAKIDVFTYIQYFEKNNTNTQFIRNAEIQRLVDITSIFYNKKIHNRLIELNINDYIYIRNNNTCDFSLINHGLEIDEIANIIIPKELLKNNFIEEDIIDDIVTEDNPIDNNIYAYSRVYDIDCTKKYKKTPHYSNLIKWLSTLTNCKSYLELGIEYGININELKNIVDVCVGVDINKPKNINGIEFFEMTTDDFFEINNRKFDIIFIDANHKYEQVLIDFKNSLNILNKFGIIIIHDTDPIEKELLEEYHCHDSYKIIDYIQKQRSLNIITLPIQETGISIVMRKIDRRIKHIKK